MDKIKIAVDFDGTCVVHDYPYIGEEAPDCIRVLKRLIKDDVLIILNTMRSGKELQEAVDWLTERGIDLYGINEDPDQKTWTDSPKVYANLYIDDASVGCHKKFIVGMTGGVVDWNWVEEEIYKRSMMF